MVDGWGGAEKVFYVLCTSVNKHLLIFSILCSASKLKDEVVLPQMRYIVPHMRVLSLK
jgi:hypothetical protein